MCECVRVFCVLFIGQFHKSVLNGVLSPNEGFVCRTCLHCVCGYVGVLSLEVVSRQLSCNLSVMPSDCVIVMWLDVQ